MKKEVVQIIFLFVCVYLSELVCFPWHNSAYVLLLHFEIMEKAKFSLNCFAMRKRYKVKVAEKLTSPLISPDL